MFEEVLNMPLILKEHLAKFTYQLRIVEHCPCNSSKMLFFYSVNMVIPLSLVSWPSTGKQGKGT